MPVAIDKNSIPKFDKVSDLKTWIIENLPLFNGVTIKANGRKVLFSKSGISRSLKGVGRHEYKRQSYLKLCELIESAVPGGKRAVDGRHRDRVLGQELYYGTMAYDGQFYGVEVSVDILKGESAHCAYAGHKVKKMEIASGVTGVSSKEGLPDSTGAINISIADIVGLFNTP
jgi:hypothetical protein